MRPVDNTCASLTRRHLIGASAMAALGLHACAPAAPVAAITGKLPASLRLIGEARIPGGLQYQGTTVGGLSGIDHDPASGQYFLITDDGTARNPARFYTVRMALDGNALGQPEITGVTRLSQADGSAYPSSITGYKLQDAE